MQFKAPEDTLYFVNRLYTMEMTAIFFRILCETFQLWKCITEMDSVRINQIGNSFSLLFSEKDEVRPHDSGNADIIFIKNSKRIMTRPSWVSIPCDTVFQFCFQDCFFHLIEFMRRQAILCTQHMYWKPWQRRIFVIFITLH